MTQIKHTATHTGKRPLSLFRRLLFSAILVLLNPVAVFAQDAEGEGGPFTQLERLLAAMLTLDADVQQLIVESDGGVLEESVIRMRLKKPAGFAWETLDPFPELLVTNGVWLWNYQPDLEQVVIEPWQSDESELAAQLLGGDTQALNRDYSIQRAAGSESEASLGVVEFWLTPFDVGNINRRVSISFVAERLDSLVLEARSGQRTVWRFENVVLNEDIDDAVFEFTPPAGVEVIQNSYSQP